MRPQFNSTLFLLQKEKGSWAPKKKSSAVYDCTNPDVQNKSAQPHSNMANVGVGKSKIHGLGVFASRNFKKGEIVIAWDISHELTKNQITELPEKERRYVAYIGGKYILMQPPARYVNHSCNANTRVNNFCDVAARGIKAGEEITANYSETMAPGEYMECKCKSKNCKGIIRSFSPQQ